MANRYSVHPGVFPCHTCKEEVHSARYYYSNKDITWLCSQGHLTKVSFQTKKSKKDYERSKRK